ncbi:MAG: cyclophilin-like fold protein [Anaerolineae bacterium]
MRTIRVTAGDVSITAELNETDTADAIWKALPFTARANTWGDEIYFGIDVHLDEADAQEVVELGDLGYWPPGHAFCLFFGRTPMSRGNEIRPASPVNVFGHIQGDASVLEQVPAGTEIAVERMEEGAS